MERGNKQKKFEKSDLFDVLTYLHESSASESQALGTQRVQLGSGLLVGLVIILTYATLVHELIKSGYLTSSSVELILISLAILGVISFVVIIYYFMVLTKISDVHHDVIISIEKLQQDIISGKKEEAEIRKEILNLFPYLKMDSILHQKK